MGVKYLTVQVYYTNQNFKINYIKGCIKIILEKLPEAFHSRKVFKMTCPKFIQECKRNKTVAYMIVGFTTLYTSNPFCSIMCLCRLLGSYNSMTNG